MCGIFALVNHENSFTSDYIKEQFQIGSARGPEFSILKSVMVKLTFGFHRLAINGLNEISNQPIIIDDIALICNGEIYNYRKLYEEMNVAPTTNSDCEVIIHLYKKYGMEQTLQMLDCVFAFALVDYRIQNSSSKLYFARDPYGVRPLYIMKTQNGPCEISALASELKVLANMCKELNSIRKKQKMDT